jgi:hypothetical protein
MERSGRRRAKTKINRISAEAVRGRSSGKKLSHCSWVTEPIARTLKEIETNKKKRSTGSKRRRKKARERKKVET